MSTPFPETTHPRHTQPGASAMKALLFLQPYLENHDCFENNVVLLVGPQDVVCGKVYQLGKSTLIGSPPPAVATELEKIWKKQFRSQPK